MCPEWALMSLPNGGRDKATIENSAGLVCMQSPDPAVWQRHNANLQGRSSGSGDRESRLATHQGVWYPTKMAFCPKSSPPDGPKDWWKRPQI